MSCYVGNKLLWMRVMRVEKHSIHQSCLMMMEGLNDENLSLDFAFDFVMSNVFLSKWKLEEMAKPFVVSVFSQNEGKMYRRQRLLLSL